MRDVSPQRLQKRQQQGDRQHARSTPASPPFQMLCQRGGYGTRGGGFGDDGLNHVRFDEEVDVEHDSGPAVPDHATSGGGYQGKRSKQPKQSTGGWGQMAPKEGRTERDEDYRAVPPPTQAFEGQRTAAMPEHATDISIPQSVSVG